MDGAGAAGADWARQIERAGWRQCSVFQPTDAVRSVLPEYLKVGEHDWVLIATQSCSVCSANFAKEPLVEILIVEPIKKFNAEHSDAQGKSSHTFHLPISGIPDAEALNCKLAKRAFIDRHLLKDWTPKATIIEQSALNAFKGWLANYYMRIALPDELVRRIRQADGIQSKIKKALESEINGRKIESGVISFWISWSTDEELLPNQCYEINIVIACRDEDTREFLDRELADLIGTSEFQLSINQVFIRHLQVETHDNLTLADLSGLSRYNEWDDMSQLPERLEAMRSIG